MNDIVLALGILAAVIFTIISQVKGESVRPAEPRPSGGFVTTLVSRAASGPTACAAMGCAGGRTRNPESGASWPTSSECREESLCTVVSCIAS